MSTLLTLDRAVSSKNIPGYYGYGLPPQTASIDEKNTDEWKRASMNFFINEARMQTRDKMRDLKKYKMLSDDFEYDSSMWSVDPLNLGDEKQDLYGATDSIQHFPIMNMPLNTILGERINRTTQWFCISEAPESRNEYYRQKTEMLFENVKQQIFGKIIQGIVMDAQNQGQEISPEFIQQATAQVEQNPPESIQRYMDEDYVDVIENVHNRILKNIMRTNDLETEFVEGFRHGNIVGKEFYTFTVVNNRLKIKNIPHFSVFSKRSPSSRWVSESQFAGYRLFLTPSSIIDIYRDSLKIEDINRLEKKMNPNSSSGGYKSVSGIKSISYDTSVFTDWHGNTFDNINTPLIDNMINEFMATGSSVYDRSTFGLFEVTQAYWKSYRKVGFLEVFLEGDTPLKQLVDENYEPDVNAGEKVNWFYLNQVYQGTDIANEFLLNVEPYPYQIFDENDPDYCPLPIEGGDYNNYNGKPMAIVDLMLPWAEQYDIYANELKKDMKKSLGKVMYMSIDNIPNTEGFTMEKWLYWCREFGIAWVGNNGKNQNSFSHYQAADMSFAEQIIAKMNMLEKIKMNCDAFGGFSQSRVAGQSSSPTQAQDQQKLVASVNQTEYYFWKHSKICERVLTLGLNIEKKLIKKRGDSHILFDDLGQRYIDTDIDKAIAANCSMFVLNNGQLVTKKEAIRQMALSAAGKTGNAQDMAELIMADTFNEIKLVNKRMRRIAEQQAQREQELKQQEFQAEQEAALRGEAWDREKFYANLESNERRTYMQTFGRQEDNLKDTDGNGQPDILEEASHFETVIDNSRKHIREIEKINSNERIKNKELNIQQEKLKIDRDKNKILRENMKNDLEIAKKNAQGRNRK